MEKEVEVEDMDKGMVALVRHTVVELDREVQRRLADGREGQRLEGDDGGSVGGADGEDGEGPLDGRDERRPDGRE